VPAGGVRRNLDAAGGDDPAMKMLRYALPLAAALCVAAPAFTPAFAQDQGVGPEPSVKRLDRFEKELREVRQIVLQAHATGQPVEIKEAGPDPQIVALQGRLEEQDSALRSLTGQLETLSHDLEASRKDDADAHAQLAGLADRLDKLEKAGAPPPSTGPVPSGGGEAAAAPTQPPTSFADAKASYAHAHQLLLDGDYPGASAAFQTYVDRYPASPSAPGARYWLGETKFIQSDYAGAAAAYLGAIHGWPQTSWAPEAVVKLSQSLLELNKPTEACGALGELSRRYPSAAPALKARAAATRAKAKCAG
jgi:tol-pal system protein YbgF